MLKGKFENDEVNEVSCRVPSVGEVLALPGNFRLP